MFVFALLRRPFRTVIVALLLAVVVLNWTYGRLPAEPKPTGSFIQIGKLRLRYVERPGTGTPVLLIHGLPGTAADFEDVTPLLAGHRTIAIDRPGFGYSSGGYVPFDTQIATINTLMGRLGIARAILVGHSYGGTVALAFAERHPSEVQGLVLVDAAGGGQHLGTYSQVQAHLVQALELPVVQQIAHATFSQLLLTASVHQAEDEAFAPAPVTAAHHRRVLAINMTRGNLEALAGEQLAANGVIASVDRRLSTISVPTVVIQGEHDKLVAPTHGRLIAATIPHARLEMVGGGHMAPYTHPEVIAAAVRSLSAG
jgi:pimeloyl-ACP methyl ester carboxylesterase